MTRIKTFINSLVLLLITTVAFAQTITYTRSFTSKINLPKGSVFNVGFGAGIPLGAFKNDALNNSTSGFAKTGGSLFLEFTVPQHNKYFGFAVHSSFCYNVVNNKSLGTQETANAVPGTTISYHSNDYQLSTLMVGMYATLPVKKFSFDLKGLIGLALFTVPAETATTTSSATTQSADTVTKTFTSARFAYGGSLTARYSIGRRYCIFLQGNTVHTSAKFYTEDYSPNNSLPAINGGKQPITVLNLSVGVSFKF